MPPTHENRQLPSLLPQIPIIRLGLIGKLVPDVGCNAVTVQRAQFAIVHFYYGIKGNVRCNEGIGLFAAFFGWIRFNNDFKFIVE